MSVAIAAAAATAATRPCCDWPSPLPLTPATTTVATTMATTMTSDNNDDNGVFVIDDDHRRVHIAVTFIC